MWRFAPSTAATRWRRSTLPWGPVGGGEDDPGENRRAVLRVARGRRAARAGRNPSFTERPVTERSPPRAVPALRSLGMALGIAAAMGGLALWGGGFGARVGGGDLYGYFVPKYRYAATSVAGSAGSSRTPVRFAVSWGSVARSKAWVAPVFSSMIHLNCALRTETCGSSSANSGTGATSRSYRSGATFRPSVQRGGG